MKIKSLFIGFGCWLLGFTTVCAQTDYYDITSEYLQNAAFDQHFDVKQGDTGNVEDKQYDVESWELYNSKDAYVVVGVFQYGTAATFIGEAVPAAGPNGEAGGGLAIVPNKTLSGYLTQDVTLLPGNYQVIMTLWNAAAEENLKGQNAWVPKRGKRAQSALKKAATGQWTNDTLTFTLTAQTSGHIQVGYMATQNTNGETAKLIIDRVRILRDHDIDKTDVDYQKTFLKSYLDAANTLYGDGSGTGAAEFKALIDEAQTLYDNDEAKLADVKAMNNRLQAANEDYRWYNGDYIVTTDTRYARGATKAFGRMSYQGFKEEDIVEQGFCWNTTGRTNAEFRARAGLQSYAIRDGSAKCCDWCADVSGKYPANETPQGFWGRHDNCKCSILYESKRGGRQLLRGTSKKWEQVAPGAGELHRMTAEQVAAVGAGAVHWLTPGEVVNNPLRILTNDAERATMNLLDNIELFIGADAITDEQKKTFEEALAPVPNNLLQQLAEYVSGIRIVEDRGYSSYNRETREIILDRATGSDSIIHELGHAFGDMLGLYNDPEFLEILSSGLNNENWYDVYRMPHPHTGEDVWVLPADKFITPYQGRIYADITDVDWSAPIDLRAFREYISISFKAFFDNKDLLKTKDPRLYQYLEGKIYD